MPTARRRPRVFHPCRGELPPSCFRVKNSSGSRRRAQQRPKLASQPPQRATRRRRSAMPVPHTMPCPNSKAGRIARANLATRERLAEDLRRLRERAATRRAARQNALDLTGARRPDGALLLFLRAPAQVRVDADIEIRWWDAPAETLRVTLIGGSSLTIPIRRGLSKRRATVSVRPSSKEHQLRTRNLDRACSVRFVDA